MVNIFSGGDSKMQFAYTHGLFAVVALALVILTILLGGDVGARARIIQNQNKELFERRNAAKNLVTLRADFERAKPYISVLQNILPPKDRIIELPRDLAAFAQKNKIEFGFSFGAETPSQPNFPAYINIAMTIAGAYDNIAAFLGDAERGRFVIDWETVDLAFENGKYKGSISARVFYQ